MRLSPPASTALAVSYLFVLYAIHTVLGCGYDKCANTIEDGINVHMVSHSHDDVGWVKTVNQYYNGQVRSILDTVVDALLANTDRKFIQVETAFLYMWWIQQTAQRKDLVRQLVRNGQLEFAGGAWSMNDEATTHYQSIIDGFTLGLRFLNDTLGPCAAPKVGWQIDSFGHSRQMATLFSELGYKALFFGRLDHRDKANRIWNKDMEIIWRSHLALGNNSEIFTSVLYNLYQPPEGFCFDNVCGHSIGAYNEESKVKRFVQYIEEMSKVYKTNNILITMGGDFTYTLADVYFGQIDYLIRSIQKRNSVTSDNKKINIFYSTPACYYNAIRSQNRKHEFNVKTDDFFPYADQPNSYWTGFYSSRPTSKRYEREGNNLLQVSKQLAVHSRIGTNKDLFDLSSAMGIMQHHDAITGTEKQFVANDYARLLHNAMELTIKENGRRIESLFGVDWNQDFVTCTLGNMSICSMGSRKRFALNLYNPLGYTVSQHVRIPVAYSTYSIKKSLSEKVPYQISTPLRHFGGSLHGQPLPFEMTFLAENIPALGVRQYLITFDEQEETPILLNIDERSRHSIGTKDLGVVVDDCHIKLLYDANQAIEFQQKLMYYDSQFKILNRFFGRPSGAYIFAPNGEAKHFPRMNCTINSGPLYDEIRQEYEPWAGQIIRIFKDNKKYIEFDWIVGRIELVSGQGKEIISRFTTNLKSGNLFRTDTNGRSHIIRQRNYRDTYNFNFDDEISSNYYPLTTHIGIDDLADGKYLTVFTDRAQGGTSLQSGEVEIMLHRRLVQDDKLGVEEVLDEKDVFMGGVARGQHVINFGRLEKRDDETFSRELILKPWPFFVPIDVNDINVWKVIGKRYFGLTRELPKDIHLLSLEPWKKWEDKILIRFEHINENGFPISLDLNNLFFSFRILHLKETTLGGNIWKEEVRLRHRSEHFVSMLHKYYATGNEIVHLQVYLKPLQIRTFVATVKYYL